MRGASATKAEPVDDANGPPITDTLTAVTNEPSSAYVFDPVTLNPPLPLDDTVPDDVWPSPNWTEAVKLPAVSVAS